MNGVFGEWEIEEQTRTRNTHIICRCSLRAMNNVLSELKLLHVHELCIERKTGFVYTTIKFGLYHRVYPINQPGDLVYKKNSGDGLSVGLKNILIHKLFPHSRGLECCWLSNITHHYGNCCSTTKLRHEAVEPLLTCSSPTPITTHRHIGTIVTTNHAHKVGLEKDLCETSTSLLTILVFILIAKHITAIIIMKIIIHINKITCILLNSPLYDILYIPYCVYSSI